MIGFSTIDGDEFEIDDWATTHIEDDGDFGILLTDGDVNVWPDILEFMYSTGGTAIVSMDATDEDESEPKSPLFDQLEVASASDFFAAIRLLERAELVEEEHRQSSGVDFWYLKLTKRGFEVAHERELAGNQQETNENIAFFTLILGFTAILQTIAAAVQLGNVDAKIGLLILTLLLSLSLALYQAQPLRWLRSLVAGLR